MAAYTPRHDAAGRGYRNAFVAKPFVVDVVIVGDRGAAGQLENLVAAGRDPGIQGIDGRRRPRHRRLGTQWRAGPDEIEVRERARRAENFGEDFNMLRNAIFDRDFLPSRILWKPFNYFVIFFLLISIKM